MQGEEKGQQNLYFHGCGHVPWEWRHWGSFSSFPAGLLGHSADCCPFTSCPTSNDWDFLWTNDPPSPGTLAKDKGSIRNSSRAVSGSGLSAPVLWRQSSSHVNTLRAAVPGSSSAPPLCTHRQRSQLSGAAGVFPQSPWVYSYFPFFLSYCSFLIFTSLEMELYSLTTLNN